MTRQLTHKQFQRFLKRLPKECKLLEIELKGDKGTILVPRPHEWTLEDFNEVYAEAMKMEADAH